MSFFIVYFILFFPRWFWIHIFLKIFKFLDWEIGRGGSIYTSVNTVVYNAIFFKYMIIIIILLSSLLRYYLSHNFCWFLMLKKLNLQVLLTMQFPRLKSLLLFMIEKLCRFSDLIDFRQVDFLTPPQVYFLTAHASVMVKGILSKFCALFHMAIY